MGNREANVEPGSRVPYVPTAALIVRRSAIGNGFDEDLSTGEDVDLVWRLREAGWRIRYDPSVVVLHREPVTLRRALARRFRYGTSAAPLAARHPGRLAPAVLPAWPTVVAVLLFFRRRGAASVVAAHQSTLLSRRLTPVGLRRTSGARWFAEATFQAILSLAHYVSTFGLPLALTIAWRTKRWRSLWALTLPALHDWRHGDMDLDPLRFTVLWLLDDATYGAGVFCGCLSAGRVRPLIPAVKLR
jgi:cellulose synthase/poly-beta-1,6-N-acetylglucosamine synthase-like glycosyltransferase